MIFDKLDNIELYSEIPASVIEFIKTFDKEKIKFGKTLLDNENYVNIEKYQTKLLELGKYETHDKYADVQILLNGSERIYFNDRSTLSALELYNTERDITFYSNNIDESKYVTLDGSNFVLLYPHEAHASQISIKSMESEVVKLVAKIKLK